MNSFPGTINKSYSIRIWSKPRKKKTWYLENNGFNIEEKKGNLENITKKDYLETLIWQAWRSPSTDWEEIKVYKREKLSSILS